MTIGETSGEVYVISRLCPGEGGCTVSNWTQELTFLLRQDQADRLIVVEPPQVRGDADMATSQ